jgi:hypothetical protein
MMARSLALSVVFFLNVVFWVDGAIVEYQRMEEELST